MTTLVFGLSFCDSGNAQVYKCSLCDNDFVVVNGNRVAELVNGSVTHVCPLCVARLDALHKVSETCDVYNLVDIVVLERAEDEVPAQVGRNVSFEVR